MKKKNKIDLKEIGYEVYKTFVLLQVKELTSKVSSHEIYDYYEQHTSTINYFRSQQGLTFQLEENLFDTSESSNTSETSDISEEHFYIKWNMDLQVDLH